MTDRKGRSSTSDDAALQPPQRISHNTSEVYPPPPNTRQNTTFAGDVAAKQRATARHHRRSRQASQQSPPTPGPVRVPGIGASSIITEKSHDSKASSKINSDERLLTAIPVEENDDEGLDDLEKQRIAEKAKNDVRLKIVEGAVEAEMADTEADNKKRKQKKCCRLVLCVLLVIPLLVGGGAGIAVALLSPGPTEPEDPTPAPTSSPTVRPPVFTSPTASDQEDGSTVAAVLYNTVCEGAFDVATTIGEPFFGDITEMATVAPVDTCEVIFRNGVGVWYRIRGDGSRYVASTCDGTEFDTQISIFSGACGKLRCVAGNDQMTACGNGDQSAVGFATENNTEYFIYVQARRQTQSLFRMLIDNLDSNDECGNAVPLLPDGPRLFGSTRGATTGNLGCSGVVPNAPGVWYTVQGINTGYFVNRYKLRLDTSNTAFSAEALVFEGDGCGSLVCADYSWGSWDVEDGVTYYIFVYGTEEASEGDYQIWVEIDDGTAAGLYIPEQSCEAPVFLLPGAAHQSSTYLQPIPTFGSCGNLVFTTFRGVWYEVVGTGGPLTVSTCSDDTDFDTQISVLEGPCDALMCVDGNDQACGDRSSVSWFSEFGVAYHIAVHGYATHFGSFTISLAESNVTVSDTCETAETINGDGVSVLGSTEGAQPANEIFCGVDAEEGPGVWYKVVGTGRRVTVSTCLSPGNVSTHISVVGSDCGDLECVEVTESTCGLHRSVTWATERGTEYLLFVQAKETSGSGGSFVLYAEEAAPNDFCLNAVGPLGPDGSPTFGSTRSATADSQSSPGRGVWYSVLGDGTHVSASTCSGFTDFRALLSVYRGDDCDNLVAVETTAALECDGFGSTESWALAENETYYILVTGEGIGDFGNFALSVVTVTGETAGQ